MREWLREEDNEPYVEEQARESQIEYLTEQEDWLYEDGANQNYTTYQKMEKNLTSILGKYTARRAEHEKREKVNSIVDEAMDEYDKKLQDLKDTKPWITDSERQDVKDKMDEIQKWLKEQMEKQSKLKLYEDPVFKSSEVVK